MRNSILAAIAVGGLLFLACGLAASYLTERQAILLLGLYPAPDKELFAGAILALDSDGKLGNSKPQRPVDICPNANYQLPVIQGKLLRLTVAWKFEDTFDFLPWTTSIKLVNTSRQTVNTAFLFDEMFDHDENCEAKMGDLAKNWCLVVVTELQKVTEGPDLVSLSRCQLLGMDDPYQAVKEYGSGRRHKDRYMGVGRLERLWVSVRRLFMKSHSKEVN